MSVYDLTGNTGPDDDQHGTVRAGGATTPPPPEEPENLDEQIDEGVEKNMEGMGGTDNPPPPPPTPPTRNQSTEPPNDDGSGFGFSILSIIGWLSFIILLFAFAWWQTDWDKPFWKNIAYELIILAAIAVLVWKAAEREIVFMFLSPNQVAIVESGRIPKKMIGVTPKGYRIKGFKIEKLEKGVVHKYGVLEKWFGLFFIGLPWMQIKRFVILHERMNPVITQDTPVKDWIERDPIDQHAPEKFLLASVLHDFLVPEIELARGYIVSILVQVELILEEPLVSVYDRSGSQPIEPGIYKADFYKGIGDTVSTAVNNSVRNMEYDEKVPDVVEIDTTCDGTLETDTVTTDIDPSVIIETPQTLNRIGFQGLDKSPDGDLCQGILFEINKTVVKLSGYRAMRIFMPKWDASEKDRALVRKREEAEIERDVLLMKAESENAEFAAALKVAKEHFPGVGFEREIMAMVQEILVSKNISKSGLTSYGQFQFGQPGAKSPRNNPRNNKDQKGGKK